MFEEKKKLKKKPPFVQTRAAKFAIKVAFLINGKSQKRKLFTEKLEIEYPVIQIAKITTFENFCAFIRRSK